MWEIKIGMSRDEAREAAGAADEESVFNWTHRTTAKSREPSKPKPELETWTYHDVPEQGNATVVSFKDGHVMSVMYGEDDIPPQ